MQAPKRVVSTDDSAPRTLQDDLKDSDEPRQVASKMLIPDPHIVPERTETLLPRLSTSRVLAVQLIRLPPLALEVSPTRKKLRTDRQEPSWTPRNAEKLPPTCALLPRTDQLDPH
jgi:hypothetical protein